MAATAGESARFSDSGLKPETVYYYAVIAKDSASPQDEPVFVSAMATAAYETAEQLYRRLPALYQRHDTVLPPAAPTLDPTDRDKGQLRRLMELFGLPLDLLRSFAAGMRDFNDVNRIDGELLRLLAQWIGWKNDFTLPLAKQRNEINYAPHYYRTTGTVANLRATINRLTTWDTQFKEFMHNVFRSNNPEALTLRQTRRR
ncbi:MAG: phage tail protein, partial [bacterium]